MKLRNTLALIATHSTAGALGFAAGIYLLPILSAPEAPSQAAVEAIQSSTQYSGQFRKDLKDSDAFHWGDGTVSVSPEAVSFMGKLAPGPDYKLYLSPEFVETEDAFNRLKSSMVLVGDVKTFDNFIVNISTDVDPADYTSVVIWCESFGQFITAAEYR